MLRRKDEERYKFKKEKDVVPALKAFITMRRQKLTVILDRNSIHRENLCEYWGKE